MALLVCCACLAAGCASGPLHRARSAFYTGDTADAVNTLDDAESVARRDRLLFLMEKGVILHESGRYQESAEMLRQAVDFLEAEEIISVSRQGTTMISSERLSIYRGEYQERLLIHTYLMMNYLLLNRFDSAFVEARQALEIRDEYGKATSGDYFTRALIAHCFEAVGETNGAYIEYKKLAEDMADAAPILPTLYRLARQLGFLDEAAKYKKQMAGRPPSSPVAEALIFVADGQGPVKRPQNIIVPPSIRFSFVRYERRFDRFSPPRVTGAASAVSADRVTTDVAGVLDTSLNARAARIIAKEAARVTTKEVIAQNIDDPLAEFLVRIAFFLTEEPDTRNWQTLPAYLTLMRVPLAAGRQVVTVKTPYGQSKRFAFSAAEDRRFYYGRVRFGRH
ncbi:MAG: hypothetical protein ACQERN_01485 [Thermodesulfobacteriota bacterium]